MRVRFMVLSIVCVMLLAFAIGCSKQEPAAPAAPAADGKSIFEAKCSVCHGVDRATARTETKEKWAGIVKEMRGKKADWISDVEAAKVVEYLVLTHGKK